MKLKSDRQILDGRVDESVFDERSYEFLVEDRVSVDVIEKLGCGAEMEERVFPHIDDFHYRAFQHVTYNLTQGASGLVGS